MSQKTITAQEAENLRPFSLGREQILTRLWQLALLSPEMTRGSIAGQMKAMSLIVAIEGVIPDRRRSAVPAQPASPPATANSTPFADSGRPSPVNPFIHSQPAGGPTGAGNRVYDTQTPATGGLGQSSANHNERSRHGG